MTDRSWLWDHSWGGQSWLFDLFVNKKNNNNNNNNNNNDDDDENLRV